MGRGRRNASTGLPWYGFTVPLVRSVEDGTRGTDCFAAKHLHHGNEDVRHVNCGRWSDRIRPGRPYEDTHASMLADATDMAVIRRKATHSVSLEKRSVITRRKRLPLLEAGTGPKMSTETSVSCSVAGIRVNGVVFRRKARQFCAHVVHLVMVFWLSATIDGQYYALRMTYYIRFIPGWAVTVAWCSRVKTRSRSDFGITILLP